MYNETIIKEIDSVSEEMITIATDIWANPEMGWKETKAVEWTAASLKAHGFETEVGAYGMPTAIRAVWGSGKPVVGFCAEYDCLPGLSQNCCSEQSPVVPAGDGHGCGHNLLGVGCLAAVIGLKKAMEEDNVGGTVIFYGCPAEEQLTGKGFMAKAGAFTECDFTIAWHPSTTSQDTIGNHTGVTTAKIEFFGKTAHAAGNPHAGRSALDALQITNIGIEFMREHCTDDVRMHYKITDGGLAPNIVPDYAAGMYTMRALKRDAIDDIVRRVRLCAEGAAHMTETEVKFTITGGIYPTLQNEVIGMTMYEARQEVPDVEYTQEELQFADEINRQCAGYVEGMKPLKSGTFAPAYRNTFASTDYGDVEHIVPGFQLSDCTAAALTPGHHWMMTACSGHSIGMKGMIHVGKVMAIGAYKLMTQPERLQQAKDEFRQAMGKNTYECPIDDSIPWPYN